MYNDYHAYRQPSLYPLVPRYIAAYIAVVRQACAQLPGPQRVFWEVFHNQAAGSAEIID